MEKQPEQITLCNLETILMPQGEIICNGKTIGWFKNLKEFLTEKDEANARLIAAAPELLRALKNCVRDFKQDLTKGEKLDRIFYAEQAIASATGATGKD